MKSLLRLLLKTQHQQNRSGQYQTDKGMTLVELLVGSIMAFLIITPMLGFVVDMLNTDRREQVKTNTEQDIQAALDFIAQDLSQAIYIYDNNPAINATATGIPALLAGNFIPPANETQAPILVFWKRQILNNALPPAVGVQPNTCTTATGANTCNDTYVLALVAYYQVSGGPGIWCQPSGNDCPSRIVRYQIQDGLKNPANSALPTPADRYFTTDQLGTRSEALERSLAFNIGTRDLPGFDLRRPTQNVTTGAANWRNPQVLVNYLDSSTQGVPVPTGPNCENLLGFVRPAAVTSAGTPPFQPENLLITDDKSPRPPTHSFYACVDTSRNLARVTIRGNSLRRLQTYEAGFKTTSSAFFPTASVQVQGRGAIGK